MAKRPKHSHKPAAASPAAKAVAAVARPQAKSPTWLAISIVLYALWFLFLVMATRWH